MPLTVAFALAAVVSPTDSIAVSAIAARVPIPKTPDAHPEGESLLNDASGLVCLRFAIAATTDRHVLADGCGAQLRLDRAWAAYAVGFCVVADGKG